MSWDFIFLLQFLMNVKNFHFNIKAEPSMGPRFLQFIFDTETSDARKDDFIYCDMQELSLNSHIQFVRLERYFPLLKYQLKKS